MLKKPEQLFNSLLQVRPASSDAGAAHPSFADVVACNASALSLSQHPRLQEHVNATTIWFVGNSVSRIHFFAALASLSGDGEQKSLAEQINMCGRGGEWRGRRPGQGTSCLGPCSCSAVLPGGGRLSFVWQQRTFDKVIGPALLGEVASIPIRAGDVVFINAGLDNVVDSNARVQTQTSFIAPTRALLPFALSLVVAARPPRAHALTMRHETCFHKCILCACPALGVPSARPRLLLCAPRSGQEVLHQKSRKLRARVRGEHSER